MHTGPVPGKHTSDWIKSRVKCHKCGADNVYYMEWESNCGGYEDYKYHCRSCKKTWWVEGADS
jgi:hypothetical protein